MSLGGAVVGRPPCLPVVDCGHIVGPQLLADAGVRGARLGVQWALCPG